MAINSTRKLITNKFYINHTNVEKFVYIFNLKFIIFILFSLYRITIKNFYIESLYKILLNNKISAFENFVYNFE